MDRTGMAVRKEAATDLMPRTRKQDGMHTNYASGVIRLHAPDHEINSSKTTAASDKATQFMAPFTTLGPLPAGERSLALSL